MVSSRADCTLAGARLILVRQNEIGKHRAFGGAVIAVLGIVDECADNVRRQEVGGELDAMKGGVNGRRQRADREGLGQAGHPLEKDVAVGQQPHQQPIHQLFLAHDDLANLSPEPPDPGRSRLDLFVQRYIHVRSI